MNNKIKFMMIFFFIGAVVSFGIISYSYFYEKEALVSRAISGLIDDSEDKTKRIDENLHELRGNVESIAESDEARDILEKELVFDEAIIKTDVDNRFRIIAKDIENYLRLHPEYTLKKLQGDEEFQKIGVQGVGKNGYSAIYGGDEFNILLHRNKEFVGVNLWKFYSEFPGMIKLIEQARDNGSSEGFYEWKELDGSVREKYGKFGTIPFTTADGTKLFIVTTAYVDDYRMAENVSPDSLEYLSNLLELHDYYNIIFISPDGYVSYAIRDYDFLGSNLKWYVNLEAGISKNYFIIKKSEKTSLFGPFIEKYGDIYPHVSAMSPVYRGDVLLGYVSIIDEMDNIFNIVEDTEKLGESGESYLVNEEFLLISPLRDRDLNILVQTIDSDNAKQCFENINKVSEEDVLKVENAGKVIGEDFGDSLNYRGDLVFGVNSPITEVGWCMLSEIGAEEAENGLLKKIIMTRAYFCLIGILALSFIGFRVGMRFNRKKK